MSERSEETIVEQTEPGDVWERKRMEMVKDQIEARGMRDERVLRAMRTVPRHKFVPKEYQHMAHRDGPLPIGHGQTISQPYIVAFMSAALDSKPGQKVLEIGTGSGYQAAVLLELGVDLYSIELVEPLCQRASETLHLLGYSKAHLRCGDGYKGWQQAAPFDRIIVTAAPPQIPAALLQQLAAGGRMILPVGQEQQSLRLIEKDEAGKLRDEKLMDVRFVPMVPGQEPADMGQDTD